MTRRRLFFCLALTLTVGLAGAPAAQNGGGLASIRPAELHDWLSYIASDDLEGRANFSAGLGLAASYIEDHLREWKVKPGGDHGSYLQTVRVLGVKSTSHSTVTVEVAGERRTFTDGEGITLPKNVGGKRQFTVDHVDFLGYGLDAPAVNHMDYPGHPVKDGVVVWLGISGPKGIDLQQYRRLLTGRGRYATEQQGAAASIGPEGTLTPARPSAPAAEGARDTAGPAATQLPRADFTTVQRLDDPVRPNATASDAFFEFLFSHAPEAYSALKAKASAQEPLPSFRLEGVKITFNLDNEYQVVRTQLTQNVIGIIEGSDPALKSTYVAFGAHYDHVGYAEGEVVQGDNGPRRLAAPGRVTPSAVQDRIWNGADDDGSGTVTMMAVARAFALGPRPKRSLLFVWHAGEERGLWGSRYFVDHPTVPLDTIVAQLNMDMVGRNRDNKASESNTVYLVGSDRISSELHAINREANAALAAPMKLDYELNDPNDQEQIYYRSDHYSYASHGIPIIFFTTGLHPDYHANTDDVSKIEFAKMSTIGQLVYETGVKVANLDHAPVRDNQGPRAGKNSQ